MLSDKEFDAIRDGGKTEVLPIDGINYTTKPVFDPRQQEPVGTALAVATLQGLVDYAVAHPKADEPWIAHVVDYHQVELISPPFGRFHQRRVYARAVAAWPEGLKFGTYLDLETFNVQLQSIFVDKFDRARVLALVGKVESVNSAEIADDGVAQSVALKAGIARSERAEAPNPVTLAPFRTFIDIEQPESKFVFRLRAATPPTAALHEADGGAWKRESIIRIKAWLTENLPAAKVIG